MFRTCCSRFSAISVTLLLVSATAAAPKEDAAVEAALAKPVDLQIDRQPLADAIRSLERTLGCGIVLDAAAAANEGVDLQQTVSRSLKQITGESALEWVLRDTGLTWRVDGGKIQILSLTAARKLLTAETYDVTGLGDPQSLAEFLTAAVEPDQWQAVGGPGTVQVRADGPKTSLVVLQGPETHRHVQVVLATLELGAKANLRSEPLDVISSRLREPHRKLEEALDRQVGIVNFHQVRFEDVLNVHSQLHSLNLFLDRKAIEAEGTDASTPVTLQVGNLSLRSALAIQTDPLSLTSVLENEALVITPLISAAARPSLRLYEVTDIAERDLVRETIEHFIEPDSWEVVGGPGSILEMTLDARKYLAIRQRADVHREIEDYLRAINLLARGGRFREHAVSSAKHGAAAPDIEKALQIKVTLKDAAVPFEELMLKLQPQMRCFNLIDKRQLDDEGIDTSRPIEIDVKDTPAATVLDQILAREELTYEIRHEVLWITTRVSAPSRQRLHLVDITDLKTEKSPVSKLLRDIEPITWNARGGPGIARELTINQRELLLVRQSPEMLRKVEAFIGKLQDTKSP